MLEVNDQQFDQIISVVMDELPPQYIEGLRNVAVTYEDEPSPAQRAQLKLRCDQTLYGLYEGVPLTRRGAGYNMMLPDKITIFKLPMLRASASLSGLRQKVKHTLWHEIAHYYGLDHIRIHRLENQTRL